MKSLLLFVLLTWSIVGTSSAGIVYIGPDHPQQLKDANLVAVVRLKTMEDTGAAKVIIPQAPVAFPEFKAVFEIVSVLKGNAEGLLEVRMHRSPTLEEATRQLGDEGPRQLGRIARRRDNIYISLLTPSHAKEYLAYLKKQDDGTYVPVGDPTRTRVSLLELKLAY